MANLSLFCVILALSVPFHAVYSMATKECKYKVLVKTGSQEEASTDAKVSLELYASVDQLVWKTDNLRNFGVDGPEHDYWERNQTDVFSINVAGPCVTICKIILSHDNAGVNPSWFVDYLEVETVKPKKPETETDALDNIVRGLPFIGGLFNKPATECPNIFEINQWLKDEQFTILSVEKNNCKA